MAAAPLDLVVEQGTTFQRLFAIKDPTDGSYVDLTDFDIIGTYTNNINVPTFSGSFSVQKNNDNTVMITIPDTATKTFKSSLYYDVIMRKKDGSFSVRILKGRIGIDKGVS